MLVWSAIARGLDTGAAAVALVTVLDRKGSAPREPGARLVVFPDAGFTGTIGGGTLEWRALAEAQAMLRAFAGGDARPDAYRVRSYALGPELGQCCGGRVDIAFELIDRSRRDEVRRLAEREAAGAFVTLGRSGPDGVRRTVVEAAAADGPALGLLPDGTLLERFGDERRTLVLFGAGHVGRALVLALAPLPFRVVWVDPRPDAFPAAMPASVTPVRPADPVALLAGIADGAFVLAMTHSHALDLEIVDAALRASRFAYVGVVGSATKRARFEKRLAAMGHGAAALARLVCPIGAVGPKSKLPAVIAAATAVELIVADEAARARPARDEARPVLVRAGAGRGR